MEEKQASQLFLVRLWFDEEAEEVGEAETTGMGGQRTCHGKVQHVITGKAAGFDDWRALTSLLTEMMRSSNSNEGSKLNLENN
jgi:hypothetical protein